MAAYTKVTNTKFYLIHKGDILWNKSKTTFNTAPQVEAFLDDHPNISSSPTKFAKVNIVKFTKDP